MERNPLELRVMGRLIRINSLALCLLSVLIGSFIFSLTYLVKPGQLEDLKSTISFEQIFVSTEIVLSVVLFLLSTVRFRKWTKVAISLSGWLLLFSTVFLIIGVIGFIKELITNPILQFVLEILLRISLYVWLFYFFAFLKTIRKTKVY